jgi:hypothetical protein
MRQVDRPAGKRIETIMAKLDLKKEYPELYRPSAKRCSIVEVPEMPFLMIDGAGDPNTAVAYAEAIEALYAMSYSLKFLSKTTEDIDYVVMPLEGLWWTPNIAEFSMEDKSAWEWTAMIRQPGHITAAHVATATEEVRRKKDPPALNRMRFEAYREGLAAQILYFGPYADEAPTINRLHQFAIDGGYELRGKHHEIYLSDPRRTAPEKLRTVIRQPVRERR